MNEIETIIIPDSFAYGTELTQELIKLRRFVLDVIRTDNKDFPASDLAERLAVLNYLIEDVEYTYGK